MHAVDDANFSKKLFVHPAKERKETQTVVIMTKLCDILVLDNEKEQKNFLGKRPKKIEKWRTEEEKLEDVVLEERKKSLLRRRRNKSIINLDLNEFRL